MDDVLRYLETGSVDPAYNLAYEEYVLHNRLTGSYLILWQNDATVVIGQNQNVESEISRAFVDSRGIRVIRRITGGGAVYHDLGNLNYSFITGRGPGSGLSLDQFTGPVVQALRGLGLDAEASGRNDILVSGKKVSGTAQRVYRDRILHHGTLLFDSNKDMLSGALRPDPEKLRSKGTLSVPSRVVNIREMLPVDMTLPQFWDYLKDALAASRLIPTALTAEELAGVHQIKAQKYDTWEWNFAKSPPGNMTRKRRWPGGTLQIDLSLQEGRLSQIDFYGDFLSATSLEPMRLALIGCRFLPDELSKVLDTLPLEVYLGSITAEEVLHTIFDDA